MLSLSNIDSLLITGANGFVGRSVYEKISSLDSTKLPEEIILLTRNGVDFEIPNNLADVTVIKQRELTKPWNLDLNCTHIINLAADGSRAPYSISFPSPINSNPFFWKLWNRSTAMLVLERVNNTSCSLVQVCSP